MQKALLISHSGLSDTNANGITMKNLLQAWAPEEKAEFYCDVQPPDFSAASMYFRVTDMDVLKSFLGIHRNHRMKRNPSIYSQGKSDYRKPARPIPAWLKKRKYDFFLKWAREIARTIGPWGHRDLIQWALDLDADFILYMVGESIYMDHLVMKLCRLTGRPLVLYNGEAYRLINLKERRGLERLYYRRVEQLYARLHLQASAVIYNSDLLRSAYRRKYAGRARSIIAYNSARDVYSKYVPGGRPVITYFGNLGVGRVTSLLQAAEAVIQINRNMVIDVYGNAFEEDKRRLQKHRGICYHGFISADELVDVINKSDILIHVESFQPEIRSRLKYAFSTKIAQCLRAGRCLVTFAPEGTASTQYLLKEDAAVVCSDKRQLYHALKRVIEDPDYRSLYAGKAFDAGTRNHDAEHTSRKVRKFLERVIDS